MFERIKIEGETVKRVIRVPNSVRAFAAKQVAKDRRPFGTRICLKDVYLELTRMGLDCQQSCLFKAKETRSKDTNPGMVMEFPVDLYKKVEQIYQSLKSTTPKKEKMVDRYRIIYALMEGAIKQIGSK